MIAKKKDYMKTQEKFDSYTLKIILVLLILIATMFFNSDLRYMFEDETDTRNRIFDERCNMCKGFCDDIELKFAGCTYSVCRCEKTDKEILYDYWIE